MSTSVSMLNRSIFPRTRSLTRGCVTPSNLAAAACVSLRRLIRRSISIIRSARILRLAASSGPKPRSRNTLPVDRCTRVRAMMPPPSRAGPPALPVPQDVPKSFPRDIYIRSPRLSGLLLEGVKNVDRLVEPHNHVKTSAVGAGHEPEEPQARDRSRARLHEPAAPADRDLEERPDERDDRELAHLDARVEPDQRVREPGGLEPGVREHRREAEAVHQPEEEGEPPAQRGGARRAPEEREVAGREQPEAGERDRRDATDARRRD